MRKIKFKGKRLADGQWVYGNLAEIDEHPAILILTGSIELIDGYELREACWELINPDTVGQFTGLLDANGMEIYDGDIIRSPIRPIFHVISYNESRGAFTATLIDKYMDDTDGLKTECNVEQDWLLRMRKAIAGNIYDNPELLKGGNQ